MVGGAGLLRLDQKGVLRKKKVEKHCLTVFFVLNTKHGNFLNAPRNKLINIFKDVFLENNHISY